MNIYQSIKEKYSLGFLKFLCLSTGFTGLACGVSFLDYDHYQSQKVTHINKAGLLIQRSQTALNFDQESAKKLDPSQTLKDIKVELNYAYGLRKPYTLPMLYKESDASLLNLAILTKKYSQAFSDSFKERVVLAEFATKQTKATDSVVKLINLVNDSIIDIELSGATASESLRSLQSQLKFVAKEYQSISGANFEYSRLFELTKRYIDIKETLINASLQMKEDYTIARRIPALDKAFVEAHNAFGQYVSAAQFLQNIQGYRLELSQQLDKANGLYVQTVNQIEAERTQGRALLIAFLMLFGSSIIITALYVRISEEVRFDERFKHRKQILTKEVKNSGNELIRALKEWRTYTLNHQGRYEIDPRHAEVYNEAKLFVGQVKELLESIKNQEIKSHEAQIAAEKRLTDVNNIFKKYTRQMSALNEVFYKIEMEHNIIQNHISSSNRQISTLKDRLSTMSTTVQNYWEQRRKLEFLNDWELVAEEQAHRERFEKIAHSFTLALYSTDIIKTDRDLYDKMANILSSLDAYKQEFDERVNTATNRTLEINTYNQGIRSFENQLALEGQNIIRGLGQLKTDWLTKEMAGIQESTQSVVNLLKQGEGLANDSIKLTEITSKAIEGTIKDIDQSDCTMSILNQISKHC